MKKIVYTNYLAETTRKQLQTKLQLHINVHVCDDQVYVRACIYVHYVHVCDAQYNFNVRKSHAELGNSEKPFPVVVGRHDLAVFVLVVKRHVHGGEE